MNLDTLRYWHRLEHFYPYILNDQNNENIASFLLGDSSNFPNMTSPSIPMNKHVRYYEVYLGIFKVDSAIKVINERLNYKPPFTDSGDDESCFCKFRIDDTGVFIGDSFRISSYPWAIQRIKNNSIDLDAWDEAFQAFQKEMVIKLKNHEGPVDFECLEALKTYYSGVINWQIEYSESWARIDRVIAEGEKCKGISDDNKIDDNAIEDIKEVDDLIRSNDLLNSFYVRDLERIILEHSNENIANKQCALKSYINHPEKNRIDIEKNMAHLFKIFNPIYLPNAKWPSLFNLRAMQQVAVNSFLSKDLSDDELFSVNGPPGTGKTTLLKDVIAGVIVKRAEVMAGFDEIDNMFEMEVTNITLKDNNYKDKTGTPYVNRVRNLKSNITQYGIIVASNNNAAVKNITEELPALESIPAHYAKTHAYFKELSNHMLDKETWGVIAVALGNSTNRSKFIDKFWPITAKSKDDKSNPYNFNTYLLGTTSNKTDEAIKTNWLNARVSFNNKLEEVKREKEKIGDLYKIIDENLKLRTQADMLSQDISIEENALKKMQELVDKKVIEKTNKESALSQIENRLMDIKSRKRAFEIFLPFLLLFKNKLALFYKDLLNQKDDLLISISNLQHQAYELSNAYNAIEAKIKTMVDAKRKMIEKVNETQNQIDQFKIDNINENKVTQTMSQSVVPDFDFLSKLISQTEDREHLHKTVPWNYTKLNILREELFFEAMNLHRTFIENSKQFRINLDAMSKMFRGMLSFEVMNLHASSLFQNLFMMIPVVSTTFASASSFLKYIGKEEIGYLLIDEAGQATPQSAVGSIFRSKNSMIVGDPLQVNPVVTMHDKIIELLQKHFKQTDFICDKETSVQKLADYTNKIGGYRVQQGQMDLWIGSPLLVHGRCRKKIFDISNQIAYSNKMIYDTYDGGNEALCKWIHVTGKGIRDHYVKEQIEALEPLLIEKIVRHFEDPNNEKCVPDVFIITPFRSVKAGICSYLRKNNHLMNQLKAKGINVQEGIIKKWISTQIGTIHTFQGKESKVVFICLGGDSGGKSIGAIQWASGKPNLLNVAVSRAKEELYIIGDINCWASKNYFSDAYEIINSTT